MTFEWDDAKNRFNIAKHGIDFADVCEMFQGVVVTKPDLRFDYQESRWVSVGVVGGVALLAVVHTDRAGILRLISARRANRRERSDYETALQPRLDAG